MVCDHESLVAGNCRTFTSPGLSARCIGRHYTFHVHLLFPVPFLLSTDWHCQTRLSGMYKVTTGSLTPSVSPFSLLLVIVMSASDVLHRFVKRDMTSHESRRTLDEFLCSPCYGYFLKTLQGPDILGYANFLDKASAGFIQSAQDSHRFSRR